MSNYYLLIIFLIIPNNVLFAQNPYDPGENYKDDQAWEESLETLSPKERYEIEHFWDFCPYCPLIIIIGIFVVLFLYYGNKDPY